jgi:hypothetical protein
MLKNLLVLFLAILFLLLLKTYLDWYITQIELELEFLNNTYKSLKDLNIKTQNNVYDYEYSLNNKLNLNHNIIKNKNMYQNNYLIKNGLFINPLILEN